MGVFTEQVQGLVSEAKIKREKQERKELLREKREEAERDLYYKLENLFTCNSFIRKNVVKNFETKKDIYNFLLLLPVKSKLLQEVTKDIDIQYYLDRKYLTILKRVYTPYKEQEAEEEKELKEAAKREKEQQKQFERIIKEQQKQEKEKLKQEKKSKNVPTNFEVICEIIKCILFIIFIPVLFFGMLIFYLIKGK